MKIEIGLPGAGTTVVIDLNDPANQGKLLKDVVVEGLETLKVAGDTWVEWSRENETPEQTEMREQMERNAELRKRALIAENERLEQMLAGKTEGLRAGDL